MSFDIYAASLLMMKLFIIGTNYTQLYLSAKVWNRRKINDVYFTTFTLVEKHIILRSTVNLEHRLSGWLVYLTKLYMHTTWRIIFVDS